VLVGLPEGALGDEIPEEDSLVFADPLAAGSLLGPEQRRNQDVTGADAPGLSPHDVATLVEHAEGVVVSRAD
jgi:hypothetical protein